jgi:hypothetical protein
MMVIAERNVAIVVAIATATSLTLTSTAARRIGHVLTSLLLELIEKVARKVRANGRLSVNLPFGQFVHDGAKGRVRAHRTQTEALRLTIYFILVELDLEQIGNIERLLADRFMQMFVLGPPG